MPGPNADVAAAFEEMADLLELQDANPFRVRAYRSAARTVLALGTDLRQAVAQGQDLTELPTIGKDLAGKIQDILQGGHTQLLDDLRRQLPPGLPQLLRVPGLGPKRVRHLYDQLGVRTLEDLAQVAQAGRIRTLPGFGEKTEAHILAAVKDLVPQTRRVPWAEVQPIADALVVHLQHVPGVEQVVVAGSFRRRKETVGDLDLLVTGGPAEAVMAALVAFPGVAQVLARGPTKTSVRLTSGLQVDLRLVEADSYGAALAYFTGSKAHNVKVRRLAIERGLKLNEYGVFDGDRKVAGRTEEEVYAAVGLAWIPPEEREDHGEVEAALLQGPVVREAGTKRRPRAKPAPKHRAPT